MRLAILLMPALFTGSLFAQDPDDPFKRIKPGDMWERFQTEEDGIGEVNKTTVTWGESDGDTTGQVIFRFVYNKSMAVQDDPKVKFRTEIFVVDVNCSRGAWRTLQMHYIDSNGKTVRSQHVDSKPKWRTGGRTGSRYVAKGCEIISKNSGVIIKLGGNAPSATGGVPILRRGGETPKVTSKPPVLKP